MINKAKNVFSILEKKLNNYSSDTMRLEKLAIRNLKLLDCGVSEKRNKMYGIKRHKKIHIDKLTDSMNINGWIFPLIVAELSSKEKWLIDGYARLKLETKKNKYACFAIKYDALVIQAKDLDHVKELYLQCQSRYGTASHTDFKALDAIQGYSRYETGIVHPQFDLSIMTREEIAEAMLDSKYQII